MLAQTISIHSNEAIMIVTLRLITLIEESHVQLTVIKLGGWLNANFAQTLLSSCTCSKLNRAAYDLRMRGRNKVCL